MKLPSLNTASVIAVLGSFGAAFSTVQVSAAETNSGTGGWAYVVGLAVALFTGFLTRKNTGESDSDALLAALKDLIDKHQTTVTEVKVPEDLKAGEPVVPDVVVRDVVSKGTDILSDIEEVIATYNKKSK